MKDNKIKVEVQPTNEDSPKPAKKKLSPRARIFVAIVLIIVALTACALGFIIQFKPSLLLGDNVAKIEVASATSQSVALPSDGICRPNLLYNSDFKKNSKGKETYTNIDKMTVDSWYLSGSSTLEIKSDFVRFSSSQAWSEYRTYINKPSDLVGKALTLTVYTRFDKPISLSLSLYRDSSRIAFFDKVFVSGADFTICGLSVTLWDDIKAGDELVFHILNANESGGNVIDIKYAKAELGDGFSGWCPSVEDYKNYYSYTPFGIGDIVNEFYVNLTYKKSLKASDIFGSIDEFNSTAKTQYFRDFIDYGYRNIERKGVKIRFFDNEANDIIFQCYENNNPVQKYVFNLYILNDGYYYILFGGFAGSYDLLESLMWELEGVNCFDSSDIIEVLDENIIHFSFPESMKITNAIPFYRQSNLNGIGMFISKNQCFYEDIPSIQDEAYKDGYIDGKKDGIREADNDNQKFGDLIFSIFDAPVKVLREAFNFEIFGVNVSALILFIITMLCVGIVIKKLL